MRAVSTGMRGTACRLCKDKSQILNFWAFVGDNKGKKARVTMVLKLQSLLVMPPPWAPPPAQDGTLQCELCEPAVFGTMKSL